MCYTIEDTLLHRGPKKELKRYNHTLALHLRSWEEKGLSNRVPGHGGGATRPIPARPAALPAMQGRGEEGMLTKGPLVLGVWAGRHPTVAHDGDGRGGRNSSECDARGEPHAMLGAPRGPMDGARVIWWLRHHGTNARWRRRPWRAARQGWGGSAWRAQGRAATLNRRSAVTGCWRRRCHRGTATSRPMLVRRRVGRIGGPPGARRGYNETARRHARG
jgi:hypothetical protein